MALAAAPGIGTDPSKACRGMSPRQKAEYCWIFRPDLRPRFGTHAPIVPSLTNPGVEYEMHPLRDGYICPCPARGECYHGELVNLAREFYSGDPDAFSLRYYRFVGGQVRVREAAFA